MPRWAIIADDLTGALDTALQFRNAGRRTLVSIRDGTWPPDAAVTALSTASRHAEASTAYDAVRGAVGAAAASHTDLQEDRLAAPGEHRGGDPGGARRRGRFDAGLHAGVSFGRPHDRRRHAGAVGHARRRGGSRSRPGDARAGIAYPDPDRVDLEAEVPRHPRTRRAVRRVRAGRCLAGCPRGARERHPPRHRGGCRSGSRGGGHGRRRSHARQRRIGGPGGAPGATNRVLTRTGTRGAADRAHPGHHRVADGPHTATSGPGNGDARHRAHPARSWTGQRHTNGRGGAGSLGSRPRRVGGRRDSFRGADGSRPGSTARAAASLHDRHLARLAPEWGWCSQAATRPGPRSRQFRPKPSSSQARSGGACRLACSRPDPERAGRW